MAARPIRSAMLLLLPRFSLRYHRSVNAGAFLGLLTSSSTSPCQAFPTPQVFRRTTRLHSVSAYSGVPSDGKNGIEMLTFDLPLLARLPNGKDVEIGTFETNEEIEQGRKLMNDVIIEGKAWPFEPIFETQDAFRGYFLSHAAFVLREVESGNVLGCFYVKPNFPGRCSHICNGGFIVNPEYRGNRVGTLMGATFLKLAKDLGYQAAYFNLVFASNVVSVKLWERLGFERVATIPNAARLEGMPIDEATGESKLDTAYGYYFDLNKIAEDYDPLNEVGMTRT